MHDDFIRAVNEKKKVRVTFFSKEDNGILHRKCAPMDFGASRRAKEKNERYHLWDYESDKNNHTISLSPQQIQAIEILDEDFDPSEFVKWDVNQSPWHIQRDWGVYS